MTPTEEIRIRHKGVVRQSDWNTLILFRDGDQLVRAYRKRPIPSDCQWIHPCEIHRQPEPIRLRAEEIMKRHPRTRGLIVCREI